MYVDRESRSKMVRLIPSPWRRPWKCRRATSSAREGIRKLDERGVETVVTCRGRVVAVAPSGEYGAPKPIEGAQKSPSRPGPWSSN